jgi:hypothetical protein
MSRSFKHVPIIKDCGFGKYGKFIANKKVRKADIDDGNNYRKLYNSYNIFDYKTSLYGCTKNDGIPTYYGSNTKMDLRTIMEYWRK